MPRYTAQMHTVALLLLAAAAATPDPAYRAQIESWRQEREARLTADGGWLTVAGLFWLEPGETSFGSAKDNGIVLPASAPAKAGSFRREGTSVQVTFAPGVEAKIGDEVVRGPHTLAPDTAPRPDVVALGRLTLQVIVRGSRIGIRLKDMDAPARREFKGLAWYPVDEGARVVARFVPHATPTRVAVPNVLGQVESMPSPGTAVFRYGGREVRLTPVLEGPDAKQLFFIFHDPTARARETYPAGRFLYADLPEEGEVVLDFNKAYTPPCAFTAYATCPLPPRQNRLKVPIRAGEKNPPGH